MTREEFLAKKGMFTWNFGQLFHIEVSKTENYEWSDPDYNGDNTIRLCLPYKEWIKNQNMNYGRMKGIHVIGNYCDSEVKLVDVPDIEGV